MRRVELYLARSGDTKGAGAGGANTLVTRVLGHGVGSAVGSDLCFPELCYLRAHGYGVKRQSACDGCLGDYRR